MQEDYASFSLMLFISMLYDVNMKCNLFGHINVTLYIENFFSDARNHTLCSSTKRVTFYTYRIYKASQQNGKCTRDITKTVNYTFFL